MITLFHRGILYIAGIWKEKKDATASAASADISNEKTYSFKYLPLINIQ